MQQWPGAATVQPHPPVLPLARRPGLMHTTLPSGAGALPTPPRDTGMRRAKGARLEGTTSTSGVQGMARAVTALEVSRQAPGGGGCMGK